MHISYKYFNGFDNIANLKHIHMSLV